MGPDALWPAVLAASAPSAAALVPAIISRYVKGEELWLAAVALGVMPAPPLPHVMAAYCATKGLFYDDTLAAGAYAALPLFIFFVGRRWGRDCLLSGNPHFSTFSAYRIGSNAALEKRVSQIGYTAAGNHYSSVI